MANELFNRQNTWNTLWYTAILLDSYALLFQTEQWCYSYGEKRDDDSLFNEA